ncbi:MAG: hypothetical protein OHK0011_03210 [Turneriella sp.]
MGKPTPITELWEVRLPQRLWLRLRRLAEEQGRTFSTVTRLCAFQLAEKKLERGQKKLQNLINQDKVEYAQGGHHRHMVCLYGEDARLLRLAALQMGISVSAFIRLALRLYLSLLAMEFQRRGIKSRELVFWKGIKRWIAIPLTALNHLSLPTLRKFTFQSFPPEFRWGWPEPN